MLPLRFPRLYFFDPATAGDTRTHDRAAEAERAARRLRCAACRHPVTRDDERIAMAGTHLHTCTNPHGLVFRIGCFRRAPGCREAGPPTRAHTWFAGYAWRVGLCAGCAAHLGWHYAGAAGEFYGLILDRLVEDASGD